MSYFPILFFPIPQTLLFKVHAYFKFLLKCYLIPKRLGILQNLSNHSLYFYFRNTQSHTHAHIVLFLLKITQQCVNSFSQVLSLPATCPFPSKCYDCFWTVISLECICRDLPLGGTEVYR